MNVSCPTIEYFLKRLIAILQPEPQVAALSEFLCSVAVMQGGDVLRFYPSEIAFACLILASHSLDQEDQLSIELLAQTLQTMIDSMQWSKGDRCKDDLRKRMNDCIISVHEAQRRAPSLPQKAIISKYSMPKYFAIANAEALHEAPQLV